MRPRHGVISGRSHHVHPRPWSHGDIRPTVCIKKRSMSINAGPVDARAVVLLVVQTAKGLGSSVGTRGGRGRGRIDVWCLSREAVRRSSTIPGLNIESWRSNVTKPRTATIAKYGQGRVLKEKITTRLKLSNLLYCLFNSSHKIIVDNESWLDSATGRRLDLLLCVAEIS